MILDHHVCMLFDQSNEIATLRAAKLREGSKSGICWILVSDEGDTSGVQAAACLLNIDAIVTSASVGMRELPISVKSIVCKLRDLAGGRLCDGATGVTFLIDMSWLLHTPSGIAHMGEFNASLHKVVTQSRIRSISLFNRCVFPEALILDVLRTHPYLYDVAGLRSNPHFLPPDVYLSGDPVAQLQCWMKNVGPVVSEFWTDLAATAQPVDHQLECAAGKSPEVNDDVTLLQGLPKIKSQELPKDSCAMRQRWKIRCLGKLRIYRQDGTPVRWDQIHGATVKTKTLFALLLQKGPKGVSADEVADFLWPDAASLSQSMNRLYHTVHCLRNALDPDASSKSGSDLVACIDHRYYLTLPEGTWVDGPIFEQFCRRGEQLLKSGNLGASLACHQVAEKLYSGPLFSDIPEKYSANTENDWCWSRRYWLEEMHVKMLTYTARIYRELGNLDHAVTYAERALQVEPCFEPAHQEAIRAFQVLGRSDAVERQYRLCCEALRRFEDRAPSSHTRALFQSLVAT